MIKENIHAIAIKGSQAWPFSLETSTSTNYEKKCLQVLLRQSGSLFGNLFVLAGSALCLQLYIMRTFLYTSLHPFVSPFFLMLVRTRGICFKKRVSFLIWRDVKQLKLKASLTSLKSASFASVGILRNQSTQIAEVTLSLKCQMFPRISVFRLA